MESRFNDEKVLDVDCAEKSCFILWISYICYTMSLFTRQNCVHCSIKCLKLQCYNQEILKQPNTMNCTMKLQAINSCFNWWLFLNSCSWHSSFDHFSRGMNKRFEITDDTFKFKKLEGVMVNLFLSTFIINIHVQARYNFTKGVLFSGFSGNGIFELDRRWVPKPEFNYKSV